MTWDFPPPDDWGPEKELCEHYYTVNDDRDCTCLLNGGNCEEVCSDYVPFGEAMKEGRDE